MANYKLLLDHIAKFEGGLSADPRDTCSRQPSEYVMPSGAYKGYKVHTNKGICYMTWKANAPSLGYDSSSKGFVNMTKTQWSQIIKKIFWDKLNLDNVKSQKIAELIFEATWASGFGGSKSLIQYMQSELNVDSDGSIGVQTIAALNSVTDVDSLYLKLWNYRLEWYKRLASSNPVAYGTFLKGWTNRMNALLIRAKSLISDNIVTISLIPFALGAFFLYKYYKRK
jgi:lysozyme family protein